MTTRIQSTSSTIWPAIGKFVIYSLTMPISTILFVAMHESVHILVGQAFGVPGLFVGLTQAGIAPGAERLFLQLSPAAHSLATGIAPCVTILLTVATLLTLVAYGRRMPDLLRRFLTWWTVFGIAYGGTQIMGMGQAASDQKVGTDFTVVAYYLNWPHWLEILLTPIGLIVFMVSCFWLRLSLAAADGVPSTPRLQLSIVPTLWRRILAFIFGIALVGCAIVGTTLLTLGNFRGLRLVDFIAAYALWPAIAALLLPWRSPGAILVRNNWLFPAVAGCGILFVVGVLTQSGDYYFMALYVLPQIFIAAWAQAAAVPATT